MRTYRRSDHVRMPWCNGGGITFEAVREPDDAAGFDLRMSFATIEHSGPFSSFAGYDRVFTLVDGDALTLIGIDEQGFETSHRLRRYEMSRFPGAMDMAVKVTGPCTAFNLITRRNHVVVEMDIVAHEQGQDPEVVSCPPGGRVFLAVLSGAVRVTDPDGSVIASALDVVEVTQDCRVQAVGSAVAAHIQLRPTA